jgi:hypothetical protein
MRGERADAQALARRADAREREPGDVDEELRRGKPHVQCGDEALAAGEDLRAGVFEQLQRLGERLRLRIGK